MDVSPPSAQIESADLARRRSGLGGAAFAALGLVLYVAVGCVVICRALPHHDGSLKPVAEALDAAAWLLGVQIAPILALVGLGLTFWPWLVVRGGGFLAVNEAGITLDLGRAPERFAPEDVLAGDYDAERAVLVLRLTDGAIRAADVARTEADAVLSAIAAGATDRALDLALARRATLLRVGAAITTIPLIGVGIHLASASDSTAVVVATAASLGLAWAWLIARFGSPTRLLVGHDGLALHGGGRARFVPWSRLVDASPSLDGIVLQLAEERSIAVTLLAGRDGRARNLARRRRDHLVERIQREIAARREASGELLGASQLDRGERSLAEWRAALRDLVTRPAGGYRTSALDPEHLASVLWSRDLAPERRLGAALALAATDDPAARQRVRVFIDTCADEALRDAVERAAQGELDDAELARALKRISRA